MSGRAFWVLMKRLHNLDYLRGLAAFGIMIYHYLTWSLGNFAADEFWGRVGVYGVSVFYILSGLTLYYVYHTKMKPSRHEVMVFAKKRFFRIYPLLWLATLATILTTRQFSDYTKILLNLTGLFGLVKWDAYLATGAWSIGNELVFYIFFPVFIWFSRASKVSFAILSAILLGIYIYFAFGILNVDHTLENQWRIYVNPLNQVFLFLGGFLMGATFKNIRMGTGANFLLLACGLCLFVAYPANGDPIHLVTGVNRIIFTISCFLICLGFFKMNFRVPEILNKLLTILGESSYSVYLLHPIVYGIVGFSFSIISKHVYSFPVFSKIVVSIVATIVLSYFVYEKFERYFMKMGQSRKRTQPDPRIIEIAGYLKPEMNITQNAKMDATFEYESKK